jgi:hypothetical protein
MSGYRIPHNSEGINLLTNQKRLRIGKEDTDTCWFTITEIEVWGVRFKE